MKFLTHELPQVFMDFDSNQKQFLTTERWGMIILDANIKTYKNRFGPLIFEEITEKYNLPFFASKAKKQPECYLRLYDLEVAKFILFVYLPLRKYDEFANKGLIIKVNKNDKEFRFQTPATLRNIGHLLQDKGIHYQVIQDNVISFDKSETSKLIEKDEDDEALF